MGSTGTFTIKGKDGGGGSLADRDVWRLNLELQLPRKEPHGHELAPKRKLSMNISFNFFMLDRESNLQ